MRETITKDKFLKRFEEYRQSNFSKEALSMIYDHITAVEDPREEFEFNVNLISKMFGETTKVHGNPYILGITSSNAIVFKI